jgi:predicted acylesterase/phospholipase RssA
MFGAYQAGVWSVLSEAFRPDIVVGASVGSLNGWAISSGATGEDLLSAWRDESRGVRHRLRIPRSWRDGFIDPAELESWIQQHYLAWTPRTRVGVALTKMWNFRPVLFTGSQITWRHLAASCAVPAFLPQYRLDGVWYADGGLLGALPLWGAIKMGATRIVTVNVLVDGAFGANSALGAPVPDSASAGRQDPRPQSALPPWPGVAHDCVAARSGRGMDRSWAVDDRLEKTFAV